MCKGEGSKWPPLRGRVILSLCLFVEIGHGNTSGKDSVAGMLCRQEAGQFQGMPDASSYSDVDLQSWMGNITSKANHTQQSLGLTSRGCDHDVWFWQIVRHHEALKDYQCDCCMTGRRACDSK